MQHIPLSERKGKIWSVGARAKCSKPQVMLVLRLENRSVAISFPRDNNASSKNRSWLRDFSSRASGKVQMANIRDGSAPLNEKTCVNMLFFPGSARLAFTCSTCALYKRLIQLFICSTCGLCKRLPQPSEKL